MLYNEYINIEGDGRMDNKHIVYESDATVY